MSKRQKKRLECRECQGNGPSHTNYRDELYVPKNEDAGRSIRAKVAEQSEAQLKPIWL